MSTPMVAHLPIWPHLTTIALSLLLVMAGMGLLLLRRRGAGYRRELNAARRDKDVVLASISDQVTFLDANFRIVWSNWYDDTEQQAASSPQPGAVCHHAIAGRIDPCPGCPAPEVLRTGIASEGVVNCADGSVLRMSAAPVRDEAGRVVGVVQTARDITEKRRLAAQLQQAQKMEAVGQLAAGVAHDFNNNLQVILGNAEMVAADLAPDSTQFRRLQAAMKAGDRAREVVKHLLTFSRRQDPRIELFDLGAMVGGQVEMLRRLMGVQVDIGFTAAPELPSVAADPSHVEQVLLNLCLNARDAMPDGGRLDLEVEVVELDCEAARRRGVPAPGAYVLLGVRDDGEGIPREIQDRVFEPFFTTKEVDRGTGLGLATVHGIVAAHGGFIELESGPGRGTRFCIGWPVSAAVPERRSIVSTALEPVAPSRILVVEDESAVRELAVSVLESQGHQVDAAADGHEALARLGRGGRHYDLVVMDVMLPGLNGWAVYLRARAYRPDLKVVFCSGHSPALLESEFRLEMTELEFLQKPYRTANLVDRVNELLARPGVRTRQERG